MATPGGRPLPEASSPLITGRHCVLLPLGVPLFLKPVFLPLGVVTRLVVLAVSITGLGNGVRTGLGPGEGVGVSPGVVTGESKSLASSILA